MPYLIVQPYGRGKRRFVEASVVGEFASIAEAFGAFDAMMARLREQHIAPDAIELHVVDTHRRPLARPKGMRRDLTCHWSDLRSKIVDTTPKVEFPQPFISSDPNAWMRPIYAEVAGRPGFATWSTQHQFKALVEAIAAEYPQKAAEMRDDGPTTQRAILGLLADVTRQKPAARQVELWRVAKGDRQLRCVAVYLPSGIDLRLLDNLEFRRTELCRDGWSLHARAASWRDRFVEAGWK